jgi:hypothetical protein
MQQEAELYLLKRRLQRLERSALPRRAEQLPAHSSASHLSQ